MARRLPLTEISFGPPTIDAVRKRLGGRKSSEPGVGRIVEVPTEGGGRRAGVVLFAEGESLYVWVAEGIVRKTPRDKARDAEAPELTSLADDARVFAALNEGEAVRFAREDGVFGEGVLAEKCRFGALVARGDGSVVGVGFRRVWPSDHGVVA